MSAGTEKGQFGLGYGHKSGKKIRSKILILNLNFSFKSIFGPKANNLGKCLILFVTILFIGDECLSLFRLLNAGLSRPFCSVMLLKINENTFY